MNELPAEPVSPREFMEEIVPRLLASAGDTLREAMQGSQVTLGVCLAGEGGGEWVLRMAGESVSVAAGSRCETSLTLIQSVDDWRGALWEGRGSVFGRQVSDLLRRPADAAGPAASEGASALASLAELARLDGLIRVVVTDGPGGDWATALKLGPGSIPPEATTTVRISDADAQALGRGELDPLQAFMTGRIRVAGNMLLMLQMQAIGMQVVSGAGRSR